MVTIKGQNLRLFVGDKCIGAATSCSLHLSASLEDASTKDSTGSWTEQECTGKSWDASADALVFSEADAQAVGFFDAVALVGTKVTVKLQQTEGEKNRAAVASGKTLTGSAWVNDISLSAANKQNSTWTIQLTGDGALS